MREQIAVHEFGCRVIAGGKGVRGEFEGMRFGIEAHRWHLLPEPNASSKVFELRREGPNRKQQPCDPFHLDSRQRDRAAVHLESTPCTVI
jgi:hypothetical protein